MGKHWQRFPAETTALLYQAVEGDDVIGAGDSLPACAEFGYPSLVLYENYALCLQFWEEGCHRKELLALINTFLKNSNQPLAVRMRYKYIRARYKHLRFALRLYSTGHRPGRLLNMTTVMLGHFQDAFRHGNQGQLRKYGYILRGLLSTAVWSVIDYALQHTEIETEQGFAVYRRAELQRLRQLTTRQTLSGAEFHELRKIVSQQLSFYDTLRSLAPENIHARQMSGFMAVINGLMGDRHDQMVADKLSGGDIYDRPAPLDSDIRRRLEQLLTAFSLPAEGNR